MNDQLLIVHGVAGTTLAFEPALRNAVAQGAAVEVREPTCLVAMTDRVSSWTVDRGQLYSIGFEVEEAF